MAILFVSQPLCLISLAHFVRESSLQLIEGFEFMCYSDLVCAEVIICGDGGSNGDATGGHCDAASRFYSSQQGRSGVQLQRERACEPATEFSCVSKCAAGAGD